MAKINQTWHKSSIDEREFEFVKMKGHALFQKERLTKPLKYIDKFLEIELTTGPILTKLGTNHPWEKLTQVFTNKGPFNSQINKENKFFFVISVMV